MNEKMTDQVGGNHYSSMAIQPIEYINENEMPFAEGCVIKYVSRHKMKNGAEDLIKAMQNIAFILDRDYRMSTEVKVTKKIDSDGETKTVCEFKWN